MTSGAAFPADAPLLEPMMSRVPAITPAGDHRLDDRRPRRSFWLPALESEFFHLGFATFSNLVTRQPFAAISADSIKSHFDGRAPWTIDVDYFLTNQFGHPYQGALPYLAARSSGLSFWWSCLYPFLSSLSWEMLYEVDAPSINDQITTTLGGIFLGEVLHRSAALILETGRGESNFARRLAALIVDPLAALNRWLFNGELYSGTVEREPHFYGQLAIGMAIASVLTDPVTQQRLQSQGANFAVQGLLTYGNPGNPEFQYQTPFSHFELSAALTFPATDVGSYLFIRGLLLGGQYGGPKAALRGVWGLFGQYDFATASLTRISSVGTGLGTAFQWQFSNNVFFQGTGVLSAVPFAAAGSLGLDENLYRDYHVGPGAQSVLELRLIHRDAGMLRLTGRTWFTTGAYIPPVGWESISYLNATAMVKLYGHLAAGIDLTLALRRSKFEDFTYDRTLRGGSIRLSLTYVSEENFGANEPLH